MSTASELAAAAYPWIKAFHIVALVAWMAGLFYLPRLFVYHVGAPPGSDRSETFKVMEHRLLGIIMNPAMLATWALGLALAGIQNFWGEHWFQLKLVLVVAMTGFHFWLGARARDFALDRNRVAERTYRILNELPTLLLVGIVIMVIVRPF
ncbi:MAG TPA: protoporphyrinogen oxidase HemJ [Bauldia sp.]|nr:protoporphyrinogen oxidase HemJ [Bauldia sp.]